MVGRRLFISAAESSGDMHAAGLIGAMRQDRGDLSVEGLGGEHLRGVGCDLLEESTAKSAMLMGSITRAAFFWRLSHRLRAHWRRQRPELVILVDSPAVNLHFAKLAKAQGIPTFYYVAPQLWAWGAGRITKMRHCIDRLACILPFEENYFASRGIDAHYVGHPLFDILPDPQTVNVQRGSFLGSGRPRIAILPGSRRDEIRALLPAQLQVAHAIAAAHPQASFCIALARDDLEQLVQTCLANAPIKVPVMPAPHHALIAQADLALVASGTATLEVAHFATPMIVMYYVNWMTWNLLGRFIVKTPHLSLVNILAGRELVPEFMPFHGNPRPLTETALDLLADPRRMDDMRSKLRQLVAPLARGGASKRAAQLANELIG